MSLPDGAECDYVPFVPGVYDEHQKRCRAAATAASGLGGASQYLCDKHLKLCVPSRNPFKGDIGAPEER